MRHPYNGCLSIQTGSRLWLIITYYVYVVFDILTEQFSHRSSVVNAANGPGEKFSDRQNSDVGEVFRFSKGNRISNDDFFDGRVAEALDRGTRKNTVSGAAVNITGSMFVYHTHSLGQRTGSINLVIYNQGILAFDAPNNTHRFNMTIVADTPLFDNGERSVKTVSELTGFFGKTFVGSDNRKIIEVFVRKITRLENLGRQFINRYIKKTLNLSRVHIHGQDAVGPGHSNAVGNQAGSYRHTRLVFLICTPISIVRNDRGDTGSGGTFKCINDNEQFHNASVNVRTEVLYDKNVFTTHVIIDFYEYILVAKLKNIGVSHWYPQFSTNRTRQLAICVTCKDAQFFHGSS